MIKSKVIEYFSRKAGPIKRFRSMIASRGNGLGGIMKKSFSGRGCYNAGMGPSKGQSLSVSVALDYYASVQPVGSSIDKITSEVTSLDPTVFDETNDELISDHPVLDLLDNPNPFTKYSEFMESLSRNIEVTGNGFIVAAGNINRPANEIYNINPTNVDLQKGDDGYVKQIIVYHDTGSTVFTLRIDNVDGNRVARYLNGNNREIYFIRNQNPYGVSYSPYGFSKLTPIFLEMEQYLHTNTHNLSQLVKGARPSISISPENDLTDEQFMEMQEQLQAFSAGSSNAGSILMLPESFKVNQMSLSNKDMDFEGLRRAIISSIHTQLGVPLPLVMPEQMTLANMVAANAQFYNSTVIPSANRIFCELTDLLMPRYNDPRELKITFDRRAIPALEAEAIENVKMKSSLNVMTDNEIRTDLGLEHVPGGDALYKPINLVPVGSTVPREQSQSPEEQPDNFIEKMRSLKKPSGDRVYTDEQIQKFARRYLKEHAWR